MGLRPTKVNEDDVAQALLLRRDSSRRLADIDTCVDAARRSACATLAFFLAALAVGKITSCQCAPALIRSTARHLMKKIFAAARTSTRSGIQIPSSRRACCMVMCEPRSTRLDHLPFHLDPPLVLLVDPKLARDLGEHLAVLASST